MTKVWIIQTGEHIDEHIVGVAASIEAAVAFVKRDNDVSVKWQEPTKESEICHFIVGNAGRIAGFRGDNLLRYEFVLRDVET